MEKLMSQAQWDEQFPDSLHSENGRLRALARQLAIQLKDVVDCFEGRDSYVDVGVHIDVMLKDYNAGLDAARKMGVIE